jgi:hypothetical protein
MGGTSPGEWFVHTVHMWWTCCCLWCLLGVCWWGLGLAWGWAVQGREGLEGRGGGQHVEGEGWWRGVAVVAEVGGSLWLVWVRMRLKETRAVEGHGALVGPTCGWGEAGLSSHGCWGVVAGGLRA